MVEFVRQRREIVDSSEVEGHQDHPSSSYSAWNASKV